MIEVANQGFDLISQVAMVMRLMTHPSIENRNCKVHLVEDSPFVQSGIILRETRDERSE